MHVYISTYIKTFKNANSLLFKEKVTKRKLLQGVVGNINKKNYRARK